MRDAADICDQKQDAYVAMSDGPEDMPDVAILCRGCEWYESCPGPEPFPPGDCPHSGSDKEQNR